LVTRMLQRWVVARRMPRISQRIDWVCGASMLIRPAVLDAIGGFDENYFLYYEETDFCRRALQAGFETWYVPESRVMHIVGQSTAVTDRPTRLPAYWFESRKRYFAVTYGIGRAALIDVVAVVAHALGSCKRRVLGRAGTGVPHFLRDLLRHSVLWGRNRDIPPARCWLPSVQRSPKLERPPGQPSSARSALW
jgi:N-acetylglucosaminyl-diphospho-decaprenol L-rhamnosyltransferase